MSERFFGVIKADSASISIAVLLRNISDGSCKTGVAYTDVTATYWRQGSAVQNIATSSISNLTDPHSGGGWKEVDPTKFPGVYRFDIPDAALAAGVDWVMVGIVVAGTFNSFYFYALETGGTKEIYEEITDASYGLAKLVRSTTPANTLDIDTSGNADANLQLWKGSAPADLHTTYVEARTVELDTQAKADVHAEVDSSLDEAINELPQAAPTSTPSIRTALALLYMSLRNKITNDGTWISFFNDAGVCTFKCRISEVSGLFTRDKQVTGP